MGSVKQQTSAFERSEFIPPDAIFDVTRRYLADTDPNKVNLGQGTYRDENGQPWILPSVRAAEAALGEPGHEYLPIAGLKPFRDEAVKLVFGSTKAFAENRVSCDSQSLSGTGALLLAGLALKKAATGIHTIYITDPTWSNHELLFSSMGYAVKNLPYYKDRAFDFDGYISTLKTAEPGSAVVLHACAHNPTGCDPSQEEWKQIASVITEKGIFPVFDSAYLGFNSGSVDDDAWAIRYFVDELGLEAAVCMSFAKSMGLYGERIGAVTFVANSEDKTRTVGSILENVQRATVSNPPAYGARIAAKVLGTPEIKEQWAKDLITMSGRIRAMRQRVYDELVRLQTPGDWSHIVKQSGMFGYTGISKGQVQHLEGWCFCRIVFTTQANLPTEKYHVYMADTSRISIAGLNEKNVEYFARALDDTVRTVQ
ncbi:aspartate aminotransferase (class I and II) [Colletotrichum plurivorum]|uniref:Aspartate aminotransferase n=1 Tax=Colletotrichum plurivorum TaxID=2175906 RepID=A0A8H6NBM3_9PEZI|nr:aspartate aminotransferase (class I and II) [Colletotrichum plurivorum]